MWIYRHLVSSRGMFALKPYSIATLGSFWLRTCFFHFCQMRMLAASVCSIPACRFSSFLFSIRFDPAAHKWTNFFQSLGYDNRDNFHSTEILLSFFFLFIQTSIDFHAMNSNGFPATASRFACNPLKTIWPFVVFGSFALYILTNFINGRVNNYRI